jgi:hypothetical protein
LSVDFPSKLPDDITILGLGDYKDWNQNHLYYRLGDTKMDVILIKLLQEYHHTLALNKRLSLRVMRLASQLEINDIKVIDDQEFFFRFHQKMFQEYMIHYDKRRDSWKDCSESDILNYLKSSIDKHDFISLKENPEHFVDIANFALFCYFNFKHETELMR